MKPFRLLFFLLIVICPFVYSQGIHWSKDGNSYFHEDETGQIVGFSLSTKTQSILASVADLTPPGQTAPLNVSLFALSDDQARLLLFANTTKVWRLNTRGDYWILDLKGHSLKQLGKSLPASTLMFAKLSPDGRKAAYVSRQNLYVEDLTTGSIKPLTTDGNRKLINGTFDWVYEEEFACRDGFQWSPDSHHISYWNVDANKIPDFYMINNTDSVYSRIIPVEYPTIGQKPSPVKIGVVDIDNAKTIWMNIPGDPSQNYLPRMEWNSSSEFLVQQLNRKQNESRIFSCNPATGSSRMIYSETDKAWIDVHGRSEEEYTVDFRHHFQWLNNQAEFLWISEKGGWRQVYRISKDGKKETLITKGNYDVIEVSQVDEPGNILYFMASPENATQQYLYKTKLDGTGKLERVSPIEMSGTHQYDISPNGKLAFHSFSNTHTKPVYEIVNVQTNKSLFDGRGIDAQLKAAQEDTGTEFFKIKTEEGIEMDGWMVKPKNFNPSKKYPVLFFVYTEPASANVHDTYGTAANAYFNGDLAQEGYIYMSIDNRGTPAPKGREWRKCVYRKLGVINIRDQALAAKEVLKWPFVDADRIAVWGWSGGGAATLNLMFQYPEIYKTGIAVSAVTNQLTYDNIYQERYMGLPEESMQDITNGSPLTYAKNLKGNLLYIHGTGDDNVHYANAEMLINELVKYNKQFQFMAYPNRTHSISEGEGTTEHLSTLFSNYLRKNCPPGGK